MNEELLWKALEDSWEQPDGEAKTSTLEALLVDAGALREEELEYAIRLELIQSTVFSGEIEKAIVYYSRCVADFDAEKEFTTAFTFDILWASQWILRSVVSFPTISKTQILQISEDIERRFRKYDFGLRSHFMKCWLNARDLGDFELAESYHQQWLNAEIAHHHPRCIACDLHNEILYDAKNDAFETAFIKAEALFRSGESCNRVPIATKLLLLPEVETDSEQSDDFKHFVKNALLEPSVDLLSTATRYIEFLLREKLYEEAEALLEKYLHFSLSTKELDIKADFLFVTELFLTTRKENDSAVKVLEILNVNSVQDAKETCAKRVDDIAKAFDVRNENTYFSDNIKNRRKTTQTGI